MSSFCNPFFVHCISWFSIFCLLLYTSIVYLLFFVSFSFSCNFFYQSVLALHCQTNHFAWVFLSPHIPPDLHCSIFLLRLPNIIHSSLILLQFFYLILNACLKVISCFFVLKWMYIIDSNFLNLLSFCCSGKFPSAVKYIIDSLFLNTIFSCNKQYRYITKIL